MLTSFLCVIKERPHLNRFVLGKRLYQRRKIDLQYVGKHRMTDDGHEAIAKIEFNNDNLASIHEKMALENAKIKSGNLQEDDKFFRAMLKLPRFLLSLIARFIFFLDRHDFLPTSLKDLLPFYSSIFVSNLASIGADAAYHHLYEFGSNSLFFTIGRPYRAPYEAEGQVIAFRDVMDICISVDERICDGFYLLRSFKFWEKLINYPELLENKDLNQNSVLEYIRKQKRNDDGTFSD